ncbi:MAG: DNA polymerase III subunit alpha [Pseudomonadales bacterium]|nr:DNA polymerase III subunit alpha [Pseudomonadales bacterium]MDP6471712.1 DNA polymerase III subunit alpha [Pseudomonadales bacterium]MDP6971456.1 DNA polymerase III subunit alpha [Pseudomonadales bacterium]
MSAAAEFVHLRTHSEFSITDGLIKMPRLASAVRARGMPAVALTDRGNLFGLVKFYDACLREGVKPIVGADLRYTDEDALESRLTALAMNRQGYQNLIALVSAAYVKAPERGLVTQNQLLAHGDGLILLCGGCDSGLVRLLEKGELATALERARWWARHFDERFYLEVQRTGRNGDEARLRATLELAGEARLPIVATNEVCFLEADDFEAHETRVCIQESRTLNDPRRERRYSEVQYLKSASQMAALFADLPEALANSVEIARRCSVTMELGEYFLPNYPVPDDVTLEQYLAETARRGLERRLEELSVFGAYQVDEESYRARLEFELDVINQMGFPGYFLIVMEFIAWAREQSVPVGPGRGSGAGSLVAYSLGITDLDPIHYDLLFERFLNPERVSMPDFDVDFCMEGRDAVIQHVSERYGHDAVSQIITFGTMAARAVVRDVVRVQDKPFGLGDRLAKLIPFEVGMTLEKAVEQSEDLRNFIDASEEVGEVMDMAYRLEGIVRNVGKHAGGVVIAPTRLTEFVPLYADEGSGALVSQFDKDDVERAGLVKFDFLGLKTLTIIDWAVASINRLRHEDQPPVDIGRIPLDDMATFELLKRAETTGVFQLESRGMKDLIRRLLPDSIDDIIALVALFRPGPLQSGAVDDYIDRKHARKAVVYPHPSLMEVLQATYGVVLYQEQVMQIAQVLAGFTLGQADLLRRAMGKKKPEEMTKVRQQFNEGAEANGIDARLAADIFDLMEKFAGYAFNKSHSATYALVAFQTAWLKTHYGAHFMAATLSADMQNTDKVVTLVDEMRCMQLPLHPPSVNVSHYRFTVLDDGVVYGLGAVRGVGEGSVEAIVKARDEGGPFKDLSDFCVRVDARRANKRVMEALIRAGAMDDFSGDGEDIDTVRARLAISMNDAMQGAEQAARDEAIGMADMFGGVTEATPPLAVRQSVTPLSQAERLTFEKEALGLYLTGHPIEPYLGELKRFCTRINDLSPGNSSQRVAGLIVNLRTMRGRRGDMAFVTLDDRSGRIEAAVFSDVLAGVRDKLSKDSLVVVEGEVQPDEFSGGNKLRVEDVLSIADARQRHARSLRIDICGSPPDQDLTGTLKALLEPHRESTGGCPVALEMRVPGAEGRVLLGPEWRVQASDELLRQLYREFGRDRVGLSYPD